MFDGCSGEECVNMDDKIKLRWVIAAVLAGAKCGPGRPHEEYLTECDAFLEAIGKQAAKESAERTEAGLETWARFGRD